MLGDQFQFLAWFYVNPKKAASAVLDHGRIFFAILAAALVTLAVSTGADLTKRNEYRLAIQQAHFNPADPDAAEAAYHDALRQVDARFFASSFKTVVVMCVVFVPVCILLLAAFCHLGGGLTIIFRDFMPVLAGLLFAWTAAQLPVAALWWSGLVGSAGVIVLQTAGLAFFLILSAPVLSTVMGVGLGQAAAASVAGFVAAAAASMLVAISGNLLYFFASPWLLYFGYQMFGRDISSMGNGLSARQNFKRQLEAATVNPRDADAHYQLGLVYVERRAFEDAEKSFRRALEIDPNEPDALFQLGRLLRQQGARDAEARTLLERGAALDPKLASHQVWRELGALALAAGSSREALAHLERYVQVREYDPEGLVLYGQALQSLRRPDEARAAFLRAIEAAQTAPKFRRRELGQWERQARQELKATQ